MVKPQETYKRAPLTEAVLELKFEAPYSQRDLGRLAERFKSTYQKIEEMKSIEVQFDAVSRTVKQTEISAGFKMTAENAVDLLIIQPLALTTSRYAPYVSWEALLGQAQENFDKALKILDRPKISRIGARFVNRIDVPNSQLHKEGLDGFFPFLGAFANEVLEPARAYRFVLETIERSTGAMIRLETGTVHPKLIEHTSVSIDIDASWNADIPLKFEDMWAKANALREAKNAVFESVITERTRALLR